jgi:hypothetical protein
MAVSVAAFGALNNDSYDVFSDRMAHYADVHDVTVSLISAGPYPNSRGESEPGRPLRAEALQDEAKRQQLCEAVAADARAIQALKCNFLAMPCMSMIGFHDGIEKVLGREIVRLSDALADKYKNVDRLGVIHMRPAKQRIAEIFGPKALTLDDKFSARLLKAEEEAKKNKNPFAVYEAMKEITIDWVAAGVNHVLFARADAPRAHLSSAAAVEGAIIGTHFDILAEHIILKAKQGLTAGNA